MPKIKILISIIVGLVMTVELLPAQATVNTTTNNNSSVGISPTTMAGRGSRRRYRAPVQRSGGGRGGFGRLNAPNPSIFPPAAGRSRCTKGRGGSCR